MRENSKTTNNRSVGQEKLFPFTQGYSKHSTTFIFVGVTWFALLLAVPTRSFAIQFLGIIGYYIFIYLIIRDTGTWRTALSLSKQVWIRLFCVECASIVFIGWYIHLNNFFPVWDQIGYWGKTIRFNANLAESIHHTLRSIITSINNDDYNILQCWVMSLPVRIFPSWEGTFFSEFLLISSPTALIMSLFMFRYCFRTKSPENIYRYLPVVFLLLLLIPAFLRPVLSGYLDGVPTLVFVALIISLFDDHITKNFISALILGCGLATTILFRRWFIFGIVGLAISGILFWLTMLLRSQDKRHLFQKLCIAMFFILLGFAIFILPFRGFVRKTFFGNQSTSYSSWTYLNSYSDKILNVAESFGWLWILLGLISTLFLVLRYVHYHNGILLDAVQLQICSFLGGGVSAFLFWRIQDFSPQHWYIIIFPLEIAFIFPIFMFVSTYLNTRNKSVITSLVATAFIILSIFQGYSLSPWNGTVKFLGVDSRIAPRLITPTRESDTTARRDFVNYLTKVTNGTGVVYFAAASPSLNSSLPYSACLPNCTEPPFPTESADVDSRDGFNSDFFNSDYVVASTPVSLHMEPNNEKVVTNLNSMVQNEHSIVGKHFILLRVFVFDKNLKVKVFRKTESFSTKEVTDIQQQFESILLNK